MDVLLDRGWPTERTELLLRLAPNMPLAIPVTHTIYVNANIAVDANGHERPVNFIAQRDDSHHGVEKLGIAHCTAEWCDAPAPDGSRSCQKRCTGSEVDDIGRLTVAAHLEYGSDADALRHSENMISFMFEPGATDGRLPDGRPSVEPMVVRFLFSPPLFPDGEMHLERCRLFRPPPPPLLPSPSPPQPPPRWPSPSPLPPPPPPPPPPPSPPPPSPKPPSPPARPWYVPVGMSELGYAIPTEPPLTLDDERKANSAQAEAQEGGGAGAAGFGARTSAVLGMLLLLLAGGGWAATRWMERRNAARGQLVATDDDEDGDGPAYLDANARPRKERTRRGKTGLRAAVDVAVDEDAGALEDESESHDVGRERDEPASDKPNVEDGEAQVLQMAPKTAPRTAARGKDAASTRCTKKRPKGEEVLLTINSPKEVRSPPSSGSSSVSAFIQSSALQSSGSLASSRHRKERNGPDAEQDNADAEDALHAQIKAKMQRSRGLERTRGLESILTAEIKAKMLSNRDPQAAHQAFKKSSTCGSGDHLRQAKNDMDWYLAQQD